jgi:hypothetical protein
VTTPGELFALPLDEFVRARDELARALRAAGDNDGAAAVKAMRKPSVPAWALDQVALVQPELVDRMLRAGRQLREVSERALAGDASALRSATVELQAATHDVVSAAADGLRSAGRAPSSATHERIAATARAAATDDGVGSQLRAGLLADDADPAGFGFDGLSFEPPGTPSPDERDHEKARRAANDELDKARRRLAHADDDVAEAEQRLDAARRRQADAAMAVAAAEAEVSEAG